jgi:hypothetical protein
MTDDHIAANDKSSACLLEKSGVEFFPQIKSNAAWHWTQQARKNFVNDKPRQAYLANREVYVSFEWRHLALAEFFTNTFVDFFQSILTKSYSSQLLSGE